MLEIHEMLDRYELLYPDNTYIADLRRSYIDKDLNSIFRLSNANEELRKAVVDKNLHSLFRIIGDSAVKGDADDLRKVMLEKNLHSVFRLVNNDELRKAVVEENLHSIFRFIYDEDLRKLLLEDNVWKLFTILDRYTSTEFTAAWKRVFVNQINVANDCFSRGQLKSKLWLVDELKNTGRALGTVFLCAGWYGTLATMLFERGFQIDKIRSFDFDPDCALVAEAFNKKWLTDGWKFKATTKDILDIDYNSYVYDTIKSDGDTVELNESPTTIINTSCEHISNFSDWYAKIPSKRLVVLQTNNFIEIEDHVNCSNTLKEFSESAPMQEVLYEGELELEQYTRFMKIGIR